MSVLAGRGCVIALIVVALAGAPALATQKATSSPMLPGANSKEPISIEADKLVYFDKEQKAIYTGNVVAVQGDSKITCSAMTSFRAKTDPQAAAAPAKTANAPAAPTTPAKPASSAAAPG